MVNTSSLSLFRQIRDEIKPIYGPEADMLAMLIVEDVSGFNNTEILIDNKFQTGVKFRSTIEEYILRLKREEPIQYILGKAYFYDNMYEVNEDTLIPRPETEELVKLVLDHIPDEQTLNILDIGTGSGCIASSIALNSVNAKVDGLDISTSALAVARRNAASIRAEVNFFQADIFTYATDKNYDLIVSNPPYVRNSEKKLMSANVLNHEPAKALFVSDKNPLIFYACIIEFGKNNISANGGLFFEINEAFGSEVAEMLDKSNYHKIEVVKDINDKDRFVYGIRGK